MAVIGKCDPPGACKGQLCSEPKDRGRNCHFRGLQYETGTSPVHSWPWEIPGMLKSGCEEMRVVEKMFLIKSINLMGISEALCSVLPPQFQPNPWLWSCLARGSCSGSSVGWRGDALQMGPSLLSQRLPKTKCLSQLGNGPRGLEAVGTAHTQWML